MGLVAARCCPQGCLLPVLLFGETKARLALLPLQPCSSPPLTCAPPCLCAGTEMIPANEKYGLEPIAAEVRLRSHIV